MPQNNTNHFKHSEADNSLLTLLDDRNIETVASHLSANALAQLVYTSKSSYTLFNPQLDAIKARACTVIGDVDSLITIAKRNPAALFVKGDVTDPDGRTIHNASAWQLVLFLCDVNMKNQLMQSIPERFLETIRQQIKAIGKGGADLVRLDKEPSELARVNFEGLLISRQTVTLFDGTEQEITYPLLENVDGIAYYQDAEEHEHFYYINRQNQTTQEIIPNVHSEEDERSLDTLKASFRAMEKNSGQRSSDLQHQLISKLFARSLYRQGIRYEQDGTYYQDSHTAFKVINAYKSYTRKYEEALQNNQGDDLINSWVKEVGMAQREVVWLIQKFCEKGKSFHPLSVDFDRFERSFEAHGGSSKQSNLVFTNRQLDPGLGTDFTLYKGGFTEAWKSKRFLDASVEFVAVLELVKSAKASIMELDQELTNWNHPIG